MKTKVVLLSFLTVLILSTAALFFILSQTAPEEASPGVLVVVYALIFASTTSFFSIAGFFLRVLIWRKKTPYSVMRSARRQGLLLGILVIGLFILQTSGLLNTWSVLALLLLVILLEFYFN